jgi:hypothetical protein
LPWNRKGRDASRLLHTTLAGCHNPGDKTAAVFAQPLPMIVGRHRSRVPAMAEDFADARIGPDALPPHMMRLAQPGPEGRNRAAVPRDPALP